MNKRIIIIMICLSIIVGCSSTSQFNFGKQSRQNLKKEITKSIDVDYLLYLPKDYKEENQKFPLLLFLHGAGERGDDLQKVAIHGPAKLIKQGKEFPFIIVSPQCPENQWWDIDALNVLLNDIVKKFKVDDEVRQITIDIKQWSGWVKAGDFVQLIITRPKNGGEVGDLREIYAYSFPLFLPLELERLCVD